MPVRMPRSGYVVIGLLMNLLLGTAYAWSVFKVALKDDFGASDFEALLPFAVAMATFSVGMVFAGRFVDRYGPRRVALLGTLVYGLGYVLSSLIAWTPWPLATLTLTFGVVVGIGTGFAYNPAITTVVRWYPVRKGLASGIIVMGVGLSPVLTAPLADVLIHAYDLPTAFLALGVLFLATLMPMAALLRFPPSDWRPPAEAAARAKQEWRPAAEVNTRTMVRSPAFWTAWTLYVLGTAGGFMIIGNASSMILEVGATVALATAAVQVLAIFNSAGRPVFGRLCDAWAPPRTLLLMFFLLLGSMALLAASSSWEVRYVGIALTGIVFGGFLAVMPALNTLYFGERNAGANYGVLFTGFGAGSVVALFAGGWIHDAFGGYAPAFYAGMALSAFGLLLSLNVRPPKRTAVPGAV